MVDIAIAVVAVGNVAIDAAADGAGIAAAVVDAAGVAVRAYADVAAAADMTDVVAGPCRSGSAVVVRPSCSTNPARSVRRRDWHRCSHWNSCLTIDLPKYQMTGTWILDE